MKNNFSKQDPLQWLARFLEKRGGIKGFSNAAIKGILCSLPIVGKTIEEVIFNAIDKPIAEKVDIAITQYNNDIKEIDDTLLIADHFIDLVEALLIIAEIDDTSRTKLLIDLVNKITNIEQFMERLEVMSLETQNDVSEVLAILKKKPIKGLDQDNLVRKSVAVFTVNRILLRVKDIWPPQPYLSRDPDDSVVVRKTITAIRDQLSQAQTVAEFLWDGSDHHAFREYLERQVDLALKRYEKIQDAFEEWDFAKMVVSMQGCPAEKSIYDVVPLWMGCLETISSVAQNQIIEILKNTK